MKAATARNYTLTDGVESLVPSVTFTATEHQRSVRRFAGLAIHLNNLTCYLVRYAIARPSVVCLSSVTFVRRTQAVQIFGNISTALSTLAIL